MEPTDPPENPTSGNEPAQEAPAAGSPPGSGSDVGRTGSGSDIGRVSAGAAARGTKRLKRKRWKRRLFALSFGTLLCLALTECSVRLVWTKIVSPWEKPLVAGSSVSLGRALIEESLRGPGDGLRVPGAVDPLYDWDPKENLRHKENVSIAARPLQGTTLTFKVSTDEHGVRAPVIPQVPNRLKVLCIGDSMTFGQGVSDDESYPAQLYGALSKLRGPAFEIYNAGVISLGQREQINVAKRLVPILKPDLVLIQFTVSNDVMDDQRWLDEPGPGGELQRRPDACGNLEHHLALTNPLARWSRAYRLLIWRYGRHAIRYRYMVEAENLALAAKQLVELREVCRDAAGEPIPAAVLIAPSTHQIQGGLAEAILRTVRINRGIEAHLEAAGIPVHDLLPALEAAYEGGQEVLIPVDRHWNKAGNAVVAREAAKVCDQLLGPQDK